VNHLAVTALGTVGSDRDHGEPFRSSLEGAHDAHQVARRIAETASELAGNAPLAQAGNKRVIAALLGAQDALADALAEELSELRRASFASGDMREGVVAVLSVFGREPQFEGQTKQRLNNPEMEAAVDGFVRPALEAWLNANKTAADQIVGRIVLAAQARPAQQIRIPVVAAGGAARRRARALRQPQPRLRRGGRLSHA